MSRIAVVVLGLALAVAAQSPATATARSPSLSAAPAAAKPSPKPSAKPSAQAPPPGQPVPAAPTLRAVPVEPRPTPNCPSVPASGRVTAEPWAQQALDFSSAWPLAQGQGITVAVVDSGVDYSPQLAGKVDAVDVVGTGYQDCVGHGTAVAAIIAARNLQARGVPFEGVAPRARILSVKVNSQEVGNSPATGNSDTLAQGIIEAATLGAQVINVSVQTRNTPGLSHAVRFALRKGAVIVAAGGNDGPDTGTGPFYPASYPYPGVLSVGAVQSDGSLAPFSDLSSHVAVTAPGVNITSAWPGGFADGTLNGTSFATAFVSGVAALVRSRFPGLTGPAVVTRIEVTANGGTGPGTGDGLVNPLQAVTAILPPGAAPSVSPPARPQAVSVSRAPPPDQAARTTALAITASALGAAVLVALGAVVIGQGRRRRWRAGRARIPADGGPVADDPSPAYVLGPPEPPVTGVPPPLTDARRAGRRRS